MDYFKQIPSPITLSSSFQLYEMYYTYLLCKFGTQFYFPFIKILEMFINIENQHIYSKCKNSFCPL